MNPPVIGITMYGRDEKNHFTLPAEYVDAVRRAGAIPFLLSPGETHWKRWLAQVNGLILTGGGDLDPKLYGGATHETLYGVDDERDATEVALASEVVSSGLPTLGICRGAQVINVVLGGTLYEHLPDVVGESVLHRLPPREPTPHSITVKPGSRLARILPELEFTCSSWHHQGICGVAPILEVVAHAPDGTIEAVESATHRWLIGVQWHPELTAEKDPTQQRLFDALVEAAIAI